MLAIYNEAKACKPRVESNKTYPTWLKKGLDNEEKGREMRVCISVGVLLLHTSYKLSRRSRNIPNLSEWIMLPVLFTWVLCRHRQIIRDILAVYPRNPRICCIDTCRDASRTENVAVLNPTRSGYLDIVSEHDSQISFENEKAISSYPVHIRSSGCCPGPSAFVCGSTLTIENASTR